MYQTILPYKSSTDSELEKVLKNQYKINKLRQGYFLNKGMVLEQNFPEESSLKLYEFSNEKITLIFNAENNHITIYLLKGTNNKVFDGYIETEEDLERLIKQLRINI